MVNSSKIFMVIASLVYVKQRSVVSSGKELGRNRATGTIIIPIPKSHIIYLKVSQ